MKYIRNYMTRPSRIPGTLDRASIDFFKIGTDSWLEDKLAYFWYYYIKGCQVAHDFKSPGELREYLVSRGFRPDDFTIEDRRPDEELV